MAKPDSWADRLVGRLALRYGDAFLRQWPDVDPAVISEDWREALDGVQPGAVAWAWRYLPLRPPLTAPEFLAICRRMPTPSGSLLPEPPREPMAAAVRVQLRRARDAIASNPLESRIASSRPAPARAASLAIEDPQEIERRKERAADQVAEYARRNGIPLATRSDDEQHEGQPW